jgi:outer membrane protein assembly factor BamD
MFKKQQWLAAGLLIVLLMSAVSCRSKYEKLKLSNNSQAKMQEGIKLYNKKEYTKALGLFETLVTTFRGREGAEELFYLYAMCNYKLKDYTAAAYSFKQFADTYPSNQHAEEARFLTAYCYYLDAPNYTLDQDNTLKAIDRLQLFINLYPKSDRVAEANKLIQELHERLEEKAYANAKLYFTLTEYQSAVIAMNNALRDYPDTKYAEELEFLIVRAQYLYSTRSRQDKQEERFNLAITGADDFATKYPKSKYLKDIADTKKESQAGIVKAKAYLAELATNQRELMRFMKKDTTKKLSAPKAEVIDDNKKIPN